MTLLIAAGAVAFPPAAFAQTESTRGWLHVIWDIPVSPLHPDGRAYLLVRQDGSALHLDLSSAGRAVTADILTYDRRYVDVVGERVQPAQDSNRDPLIRAQTVRLSLEPTGGILRQAAPLSGSGQPLPFVTVLCRFADDPSTPFLSSHTEKMVGSTYPGMAHYFAELAEDPGIMTGNHVTGWYTLPSPRVAYTSEVWGGGFDLGALARDCTAAADPDVFFPAYFGVNLQFTGNLRTRATPPHDVLSFGGSYTLTLDDQTLQYGMTWLSGAHSANYVVYAHEMGHALGWPHSNGCHGDEYDSRWDVMSAGYVNNTSAFGWLPIHTIAAYKDRRGWISAERRWEPQPGSNASGIIERSALPPGGTGYRMARIPLGGGGFYTVESRRIAGYDARLPGEAVVMHNLASAASRACVVDPDNNTDPNDDGAMWLPGETFVDSINGVVVRVDSATATGFAVTITRSPVYVLVISDPLRREGIMGTNYADTLRAQSNGGTATWWIDSGALPEGVVLDTLTGIVRGIPAEAGAFHFSATATAGPVTATRAFTMNVTKPVVYPEDVLGHLLGSPALSPDQLRFLDLLGNRNLRLDVGDVRAWLIDSGQLTGTAAQSLREMIGMPEGSVSDDGAPGPASPER